MKAYSGSTSESFLPTLPGATPAVATAPAPEDPSARFTDFLQDHSLTFGAQPNAAPATITADEKATPASLTDWMSTSINASNLPATLAPPSLNKEPLPANADATSADIPEMTASESPADPASASIPLALTHGAWMSLPVASRKPFPTAPTAPTATDPTAPTAPTAPAPSAATDPTAAFLPNSPLALFLAHSGLADVVRAPLPAATPATRLDSNFPTQGASGYSAALLFQGSAGRIGTPVFAEKKSPIASTERSFIQAKATPSTTLDAMAQLLAAGFAVQTQAVLPETITPAPSSAEKTATGLPSSLPAAAGTTNDKKEVDMNATLEMTSLATAGGTDPLGTKASADVHILLGTNHDFNEAIDHVMHVAELSNLSLTSNPLRVAIEIQTPPGAIVNIYVSRQADSSYRAQLSTNDVQALGWVQDQIGSLKSSTSTGTDIRWAPAQLENGPAATANTSSSNGGNLDWNRGGNQNDYPPQDERNSRQRSSSVTDEDDTELGLPFFETLGAIGSAA